MIASDLRRWRKVIVVVAGSPKTLDPGSPQEWAAAVRAAEATGRTRKDAIKAVAKEKWGEKAEGVLGVINDAKKSAWTRGPYRNSKTGDVYDGFQGMFHLNARTGGDKPGPKTYNRAKQEVGPRDGVFYPGCYVDAVLDIYAQDHPQYGRRINCGLLAVRFVADGESFSGGGGASADDFADLPSDDNDDLF